MPTLTPEYEFNLPTPGSDDNNWGDLLNANWTSLDTLIKAIHDKIAQQLTDIHYRVGALKLTTENVNPSTYIPGTTWALYGAGRAFVGVGTADGVAWAAEQERGVANVTLTTGQLPPHRHHNSPPNFWSDYAGEHKHDLDKVRFATVETGTNRDGLHENSNNNVETKSAGNHRHLNRPTNFYSANTGSGQAHTNIQPSIAVYAWRRTA